MNSTGVDAGAFTRGEELVEAFRDYSIPCMNMVWADDSGNIGYKLVGKLPIRRGGCPDLPKPGWTGEYEWDGYIPYEELPEIVNPPGGVLVTANNRIAPDDYPHHITSEYLDGYRAARIEQLLGERERLSLDDFERIQLDLYSIPGEQTAHRLARLRPTGQREVRAIERLKSWDHRLDPETIAGTIYAVFTVHFARLVSDAVIGDEDHAERWRSKSLLGFTPMVTSPWRFQARLIELWDEADPELIGGRSWDELALEALRARSDELEQRFGQRPRRLDLGPRARPALPPLAGRGHAARRRSCSTACCRAGCRSAARRRPSARSASCRTTASYTGSWAPSYRLLADLGRPERSRWQHMTGQSGHPGSPHYDDLLQDWLAGRSYEFGAPGCRHAAAPSGLGFHPPCRRAGTRSRCPATSCAPSSSCAEGRERGHASARADARTSCRSGTWSTAPCCAAGPTRSRRRRRTWSATRAPRSRSSTACSTTSCAA